MSTTKYLHKAIFINSAQIPYQEIDLDGNVHFIGTQGTGKSTVQRALLFFYTAASRRSQLGLSSSQKSLMEYYFPYENAYLVYEIRCKIEKDGEQVDVPEESFMVIVFKRASGLRFLFARSSFKRTFFLEEDGVTVLLPQSMQRQLSNAKCYTSPVIDSGSAYRDIIYGKNRSQSTFSLFKSNAYENIPQTIEKIFLNASLHSDAIKTTIIDSAILQHVSEFELESHKKQLRDFQGVKNQVTTFHNNKAQVGRFLNSYQQLLSKRLSLQNLAVKIFHAVGSMRKEAAVQQEEIDKLSQEIANVLRGVGQEEQRYQASADGFKNQIHVLKRDIEKGERLNEKYLSLGIAQLLEENKQEKSYQLQADRLKQQRQTLMAGVAHIEEYYLTQKRQIDQQYKDQYLLIENDKQKIKGQELERKTLLQQHDRQKRNELATHYATILEEQEQKLRQTRNVWEEAKRAYYSIQNSQPFQKEIQALEQQERENISQNQQAQIAIKQKEYEIKMAEGEYKLRESEKKQALKELKQTHQPAIRELNDKITALEGKLGKLDGAIYGFLQANVPQWERQIGKVIDEELLFFPSDDVSYDQGKSASVFGLSLPLESLPNRHGPKDYAADLEYYQQEKEKQQEAYENELTALQKKYDAKFKYAADQLRVAKKELEQNQYQLQQGLRKRETCRHDLEEMRKESIKVLQEKIAQALANRQECQSRFEVAELAKEAVKKQYKQQENSLQEEFEQQFNHIEAEKNQLLKEQDAYMKQQQDAEQKALDDLKRQEYQELNEQQLDTNKIAQIDTELQGYEQRLEAIHEHRNTVISYQKDHSEYITTLPEHKRKLAKNEGELGELSQAHRQKMEALNQERNQLQGRKNDILRLLEKAKDQLSEFDKSIAPSKIWAHYQSSFPSQINHSTETQVTTLYNQLSNEHYALKEEEKAILEACMHYVYKFPEDNVFGFDTRADSPAKKEELLNYIQHYLKEDNIKKLEKELGHKFSLMLKRINKDYESLLSQKQTVDQLVRKINGSFKQGNFVGAVKSIEMQTVPSRSVLIQELKHINDFMVEHGHDIGEQDLFSDAEKQQSANQQAILLLERFYDAMQQSKMASVKLSDTFELQFRVKENENDTGWMESVRSVGSNGTDVLVKAMVYITLLQVFKEQVANTRSNTQKEIAIWLHCIIDEVGILHDSNIQGLATFANERGIWLINGSPNANDAASYKHIYQFRKNNQNKTQIVRLLSKLNSQSHVN